MAKISEPVIMLTHNDITVGNAPELFSQLCSCPVEYWGIKEQGLCELGGLVDFENADDVIFLYSTVLLNNSVAMK